MNTFLMITHVQRSQMHGEINQKRNGELMFERKLVLEGEMNVTYYSFNTILTQISKIAYHIILILIK